MKKIVFALLAMLISTSSYSQDIGTLSCEFSEFIKVSYARPEQSQKIKVHQTMRIVQGETTTETLQLDGSLRATNSTHWTKITPMGFLTWEVTFIGDFGDVLTLRPIVDDLGANKKPLHGWYKASLVSNTVESTSILIGTCFVE
jgi:hypothetical protein